MVPSYYDVAPGETGQSDVGKKLLYPEYIPAPLLNGGNKGCKELPRRSPHPAG